MAFPRSRPGVEALADRHLAVDDDGSLAALVTPVRNRGCLTRSDVETVGRWKSARVLRHVQRNTEEEVREVTQWALTTSHERLRAEWQFSHENGEPRTA